MRRVLKGCTVCFSVVVLAFAIGIAVLQQTVWWASYDFDNCNTCKPRIDWQQTTRGTLTEIEKQEFFVDGVTVLKKAVLDKALIDELSEECDRLPNTFMTDILANVILRFYLRYEHRLESRSELLRDWAVHGPFGKWAAQLLGVEDVRLYNTELIFHRGDDSPTCKPAWHRDSLAAPFDPEVPSAVFNIYLHDIDAEHDGLVYVRGSHTDVSSMPNDLDIIEPKIEVGDVLVHSANAYHTTSGRGCFKRRSLQFRYFAADSSTKFSHGPLRQSGPLPWTFAHAEGIAPHGLKIGDKLAGPWYPLVHPKNLDNERGIVPSAEAWGVRNFVGFISEHNALWNASGQPAQGALTMDGLVKDPADWYWKAEGPMVMPALKKAMPLQKFQR